MVQVLLIILILGHEDNVNRPVPLKSGFSVKFRTGSRSSKTIPNRLRLGFEPVQHLFFTSTKCNDINQNINIISQVYYCFCILFSKLLQV